MCRRGNAEKLTQCVGNGRIGEVSVGGDGERGKRGCDPLGLHSEI